MFVLLSLMACFSSPDVSVSQTTPVTSATVLSTGTQDTAHLDAAPATRTGFRRPGPRVNRAAVGPIPSEWTELLDPRSFPVLPPPEPGDWLAEHDEQGQTYEDWRQDPGRLPTANSRTIRLQPVGSPGVNLEAIALIAEAWFGLPVEIARTLPVESTGASSREHADHGHTQLLSTDLLSSLESHLDDETFAVVGVVEPDLYPHPDWNFVFGHATYDRGVGVWSTARLNPGFPRGRSITTEARTTTLRRTTRIMTHEMGHMFGMKHCTYFRCAMNGSNSLEETDSQATYLCPVCLHKLLAATGIDPLDRYSELEAVFEHTGLTQEAAWVRARLQVLTGPQRG